MKPSPLAIPMAIILGGIVVAGALYFSLRNPTNPGGDTGNPALVRPVTSRDHLFGNPAAPILIVEYSDFDCEFCKSFHETLHEIIAQEGADGTVAWVFREFPLSEIHPNALLHARAAECAAEVAGNDAFWKFTDEIFAHQPVDPSQYGTLAKDAGISGNFATCYASASSTIDARIAADRQNALDIGARGAPYSLILIKGRAPVVIDGAYPYDAVKLLINQALGK